MTTTWKPKSKSVRSHPHTGSFRRVRSTRIFWENGVSRSWRRGDGRPDVSGIGGWRPGEGPADTLRLPGLQGCGTRRRRSWARRPFLLPTQLLLLLLKDHLAQPLPLSQFLCICLRHIHGVVCVSDGRHRPRKLGDAAELPALRVPWGVGRCAEAPL